MMSGPLAAGNQSSIALPDAARVMHISGDFPNQAIYQNLVDSLEKLGVRQRVVSAVRSAQEAEWHHSGDSGVEFIIRRILRRSDRVLFHQKIRKIVKLIEREGAIRDTDVIHAHSLYSDGVAALRLKQKYKIPYIVAVRNTDVNVFMKYRPDLSGLRNRTLVEAEKVVFLSPAYRDAFLASANENTSKIIAAKAIVVPNGVGRQWLVPNPGSPTPNKRSPFLRVLYVGDGTPNKNLSGLCKAVLLCGDNVTLDVVGILDEDITLLGLPDDERIRFLGRVQDSTHLRDIYRSCDILAVPSFTETFGVVYIEALSQGLPIVHSRGQGVSGYFEPGCVSEEVDPSSAESIRDGILALANRLPCVRARCVTEAKRFSWDGISEQYATLYMELLANR